MWSRARFHQLSQLSWLVFAAVGLIGAVIPVPSTYIQTAQTDFPYYIVKEGDTLWEIAARFGVSLTDLQAANDWQDQDVLSPGVELLIPHLAGYSGPVDTVEVTLGETINSLSRRYQVSRELIGRLNRLVSPANLYVGAQLILPEININMASPVGDWLPAGDSLLEAAARNGSSLWKISKENGLEHTWDVLGNEAIVVHRDAGAVADPQNAFLDLPNSIREVAIEPRFPVQGKTSVIKILTGPDAVVSGSLAGMDLKFFPSGEGYVALQGIHALQEPGLYPLVLRVADQSMGGGESFEFAQSVLIQSGDYLFDPPLIVDPQTIDPAVTEPEDKMWQELGAAATAEKMWAGQFVSPVPAEFTDCWTSFFGNRRSYNGGAYESFHSGLDFCGGVGTQLFAPAAGKVVFAGPLAVRGNATVIDHGWGVYTAYDHQSEILVEVGERVSPGQLIGLGGATGRVTGPHLHWEVWAGGVQVDPLDWLNRSFP